MREEEEVRLYKCVLLYCSNRSHHCRLSTESGFKCLWVCRDLQLRLEWASQFCAGQSFARHQRRVSASQQWGVYLQLDGTGAQTHAQHSGWVKLLGIAFIPSLIAPLFSAEDCQFKCAELGACVNASVWCDGIVHCPSGDDETFLQCSALMKLPAEILATLCLIFVLSCCAFAAFAYKWDLDIIKLKMIYNIYILILQKNQAQAARLIGAADASQVAQLHGYRCAGWKGGDLLTKRQFCALRWDRSCDHGLMMIIIIILNHK